MTRTPLRPLARVIEARAKGENPDAIERENLRLRHEEMRDRDHRRQDRRRRQGQGVEHLGQPVDREQLAGAPGRQQPAEQHPQRSADHVLPHGRQALGGLRHPGPPNRGSRC